MTDDTGSDSTFDRRKVLAGLGAGAAAGIAGCSSNGDGGGGTTDGGGTTGGGTTGGTTDGGTTDGGTTDEETPTETDDGQSKVSGGKPVIGMTVAPTTLNALQAGSTYDFMVIDRIYTYGTTVHPKTNEFEPWLFTDWEITPENVGTDSPTLTATMRGDMSFHDGEDLTAEDYKFTQMYFKEQNPTNSLTGSAQQNISKVEVQSPTEVDVYMSQKDQRWFTNILGHPVLPKHIWSNVDDYTKYVPRDSEEGVVGSGAWKLTEFSWQNWYELETVDDYPIPGAEYVDWIDSEGPYVDGLRIEIFGSQTAMEQAFLSGEIDTGFHSSGFSVNNAVKAKRDENFTVHQNSSDGYNHVSYNTRRVPFDDVAFRQFMNKAMDKKWILENPHQGIRGTAGDYVVIPALDRWRPPQPEKIAGQEYQSEDRFDPVSIPDLSFPQPGAFNMTPKQIADMRRFLINNPNAKHDYSFGESQTDITRAPTSAISELDVPEAVKGAELYVNGKHLTEAHTNNAGEGGQGPLEYSFQPPQEDIVQARYGQQYLGMLKKIGVPIEPKVKTINAQLPTIYAQEDFDLYAMAWGLGVNVTHLLPLYSSEGADTKENIDTQVSNPMEYTGADDLIFQDGKLMDFSKRTPIVKQILAKIYHDSPTNVTDISKMLEPTTNTYKGWVGTIGGIVTNEDSYLNIAKTE